VGDGPTPLGGNLKKNQRFHHQTNLLIRALQARAIVAIESDLGKKAGSV
jgi:hypothetical protein